MNRKDFQTLARIRLKEARVLLRNECYDGAYYLAGYAVECALKACVAKKTRRYDFPPKSEKVKEMYTHDLDKLVRVAELKADLDQECRCDQEFKDYWEAVTEWSEQERYERITEPDAMRLLRAISDLRHGVLRWIRHHW